MQTDLKKYYEQYLIDCINQQCALTKKHIDEHRKYFANNRQSSGFSDVWKQLTFALCTERSENAYVYDLDENKYIDITMGFGVHLFGHSTAFIKEAINQKLNKGFSLGPLSSDAAETAKLICLLTNNDRCAFFNSGTEAVMVALRLARAYIGKPKIVIFEGAYHGTHDSLLTVRQHPDTKGAISSIPGISHSHVQDTILLTFGSKESLDFINEHAGEIAAVLTEPVRSRHLEEINPAYLRQLQEICQEKGICFILDEVITGFRLANGGAKFLFDLDPDLLTYGKVLGGGLPIGVVAGKKQYLDYIDGGYWNFSDLSSPYSLTTFVAGTFCHHPLAMATSKATLEFLLSKNNKLQEELNQTTELFCTSLNHFCKDNNIPISLVYFGSIFRFQVKGKNRIFYHALLKEKIYVWEGRTCFLSTAHQKQDLDHLKLSIQRSLIEMKSAGFFPDNNNRGKVTGKANVFLQTAFEINEQLDLSALELAFNYACETISGVNKICLNKEYLLFPVAIPEDFENVFPFGSSIHLRLIISTIENKTVLWFQFSKCHFDGWSMILFIRFFSACFRALEKRQLLPINRFTPILLFEKWAQADAVKVHDHEVFAASVISRYLPAVNMKYKGTLFEYLLSCFALALGNGEYTIGVPISGQMVSRYIHTIGACTCQVPILLSVTTVSNRMKLTGEINAQLAKGKRDFRRWYHNKTRPQFPIVFNMDNLVNSFLFAERKIKWAEINDKQTSHEIVCNVTIEPNGLFVSIKFSNAYSLSAIKIILDNFSALVTQHDALYK